MKNPLRKRLLRELKSEFGKYLVIFLLLTGSIGFVSGFLVADGSMLTAYQESFAKYNIEDGNFRLTTKANKAQIKAIQSYGITLYDNFYIEEELTNTSTLRIFANRKEVNQVCLMEGIMPKATGEIAIDRMYAENNQICIGDTLSSNNRTWTVTGLVALSDYSALFSDNNDSMFDAIKFGVSIVTQEEFDSFDENLLSYCYSWKYDTAPASEIEEKELSDNLMKNINQEVSLESFVPRYLNQAIQFTGEDMGSDKAMMIVLLYIIIAIMAFVFGITTSNTIVKEANVIGTLRASGYTKGELIRHYMTMPMLVTAVGAIIGNLLGYTVFKNICANMYYGSYSLPTYVTIWNAEAFLMTTVVPVLIMIAINFVTLQHKLALSPLKFLRHDLSKKNRKHTLSLNPHIPFFTRFRLRVIFQNISNYCVLFVGILFANLLLMFGLLLPSILSHYQKDIQENMLCQYQYMLQIPINATDEEHKLESFISLMYFQRAVETDNKDAEKFSAYSLKTLEQGYYKSEEILLYGIQENSSYIPLNIPNSQVYISSAYADKYELALGDVITLQEAYEDTQYSFQIGGIYDYIGGLTIFMSQNALNQIFDLDDEYFCGYFSNTEITDIDEQYIASVISLDDLTKISRQLEVSMGSMMYMVNTFAIVIFMVLIYLLSKIIIEKNAHAISMTKILGYTNIEISRLYIISTSVVVILFLLISLPIETWIMQILFKIIMIGSLTGWIPFYVDPIIYTQMLAMGILTYAIVAILEYRKIRKVPMDEALKHVE